MTFFDFNPLYQALLQTPLSKWIEVLPAQLQQWQQQEAGKRWEQWLKQIHHLPSLVPDEIDLTNRVFVQRQKALSEGQTQRLTHLLMQFSPWRKGPFSLYGVDLDAEWRSDLKWDRALQAIEPLKERCVLDVGCNSGYYLWRMLGAGAKLAIGIDPMALFFMQFQAVKKLIGDLPAHFVPVGIESLPELNAFDTVFSMGVLYHRRSPFDHLLQLKNQLRDGGQLVLETLAIEGDENSVLVPQDRYAKMSNIYFIPSVKAMLLWLKKAGFKHVQVADCALTDPIAEQRKTPWMTSESLSDFLDPHDSKKTLEGYPAPLRALFTAIK